VKERGYEILPWALTELQPHGLDTDELGAGSFWDVVVKQTQSFWSARTC